MSTYNPNAYLEPPRVAAKKKFHFKSSIGTRDDISVVDRNQIDLPTQKNLEHVGSAAILYGASMGLTKKLEVAVDMFVFAPILTAKYQFFGQAKDKKVVGENLLSGFVKLATSGIGGAPTGTSSNLEKDETSIYSQATHQIYGISVGKQISKSKTVYFTTAYSYHIGQLQLRRIYADESPSDETALGYFGESLFFGLGIEIEKKKWSFIIEPSYTSSHWNKLPQKDSFQLNLALNYFMGELFSH